MAPVPMRYGAWEQRGSPLLLLGTPPHTSAFPGLASFPWTQADKKWHMPWHRSHQGTAQPWILHVVTAKCSRTHQPVLPSA